VTGFAQTFEKGRQLSLLRVTLGGIGVEKPNYRHCRLLRTCGKRPSGCRGSNSFDEISPAHATILREAKDDASFLKLIRLGRRCPLWVKSGHVRCKTSCLLYPQKRPQKRTLARS